LLIEIQCTYNKQDVEFVPGSFHAWLSDLSDHSVETERNHGGERNTLSSGFGIEDFSWDDPG
jgi:hypothetical protein